MNARHSTPLLPALLAAACGLSACGSGEGTSSSAPEQTRASTASDVRSVEAAARKGVADILAEAKRTSVDYQAEMRREVPLPSHRRLLSFLPQELPDFPFAKLESELEKSRGTAEATGRYQLSQAHYRGGIELQITYYGKQAFNGPKKYFDGAFGERVEVSGFPALLVEEDSRDDVHYELTVRISPEVYACASGPGSPELIRDAAAAIDLAGLGEAVESELLFEPTRDDRLEAAIPLALGARGADPAGARAAGTGLGEQRHAARRITDAQPRDREVRSGAMDAGRLRRG